MKKLLTIFILSLYFITPSQALSIKDFDIEGITIDDNILNHFSRGDIEKNIHNEVQTKNNNLINTEFFGYEFKSKIQSYDSISILYDKGSYKIKQITGNNYLLKTKKGEKIKSCPRYSDLQIQLNKMFAEEGVKSFKYKFLLEEEYTNTDEIFQKENMTKFLPTFRLDKNGKPSLYKGKKIPTRYMENNMHDYELVSYSSIYFHIRDAYRLKSIEKREIMDQVLASSFMPKPKGVKWLNDTIIMNSRFYRFSIPKKRYPIPHLCHQSLTIVGDLFK